MQRDPRQHLYPLARGSNLVYSSNEQIIQLATLGRRQYNPTLALRTTAINEGDSPRATLGESPAWDGLSRYVADEEAIVFTPLPRDFEYHVDYFLKGVLFLWPLRRLQKLETGA